MAHLGKTPCHTWILREMNMLHSRKWKAKEAPKRKRTIFTKPPICYSSPLPGVYAECIGYYYIIDQIWPSNCVILSKIIRNKIRDRIHLDKPIESMYGKFTCIYHKSQPNVGQYTSPMDPMGKKTSLNGKATFNGKMFHLAPESQELSTITDSHL